MAITRREPPKEITEDGSPKSHCLQLHFNKQGASTNTTEKEGMKDQLQETDYIYRAQVAFTHGRQTASLISTTRNFEREGRWVAQMLPGGSTQVPFHRLPTE